MKGNGNTPKTVQLYAPPIPKGTRPCAVEACPDYAAVDSGRCETHLKAAIAPAIKRKRR